ncbi:hypothetical protein TELCIR_21206 [Teladorsagia circumcincta]|uniref:Uncharacterized protein n=1 Tax=Teladorsagia circumcincta TaxID=45464 RepID=A0A2G9THE5_TELCI|nr:hypothetical protein TELCIR_21206 [Teladorsagia circumcincta]
MSTSQDGTVSIKASANGTVSVKAFAMAEPGNLVKIVWGRAQLMYQVNDSEWATQLVIAIKPGGKVRICGDYKITLNAQLNATNYYPHHHPQALEMYEIHLGTSSRKAHADRMKGGLCQSKRLARREDQNRKMCYHRVGRSEHVN